MAGRVFLLSPANCSGERARILLRPQASFPLALQLRSPEKAELADVFSFTSGLYFRGKITYARAFARPPGAIPGSYVITPSRGLLLPETRVGRDDILAMAAVPLGLDEPRYRAPLERDARALAEALGAEVEVVLLGSIATGKYVDVLLDVFGDGLLFPEAFVGRGDLSRGGLLLRATRAAEELAYVPVRGSRRHGPRPPRLPRPG